MSAPRRAAATRPVELSSAPPGAGPEAGPEVEPTSAPAPLPAAGAGRLIRLGGRLGLERWDWWFLLGLTAVAFVLRFASPIMPNVLTNPLGGWPVTNCVQGTPVDARGDRGTLCGLAYPFQRSYAQAGQPASPPEGEIFDEIYFGVFAHDDLKGISYFDPEPPTSKLIIAAGEWLYGGYRAVVEGARGSWADLGFTTFGWRLMSTIFGTLCVPLMFLLALQLWRNRLFAVSAGVLACFDGMFFIQSRIGMIDIFPIFFILASYLAFAVHRRSRNERESLATLAVTGAVLAVAISSKWIALAAWASIVFFLALAPVMRRVRVSLASGWSVGGEEGPWLPGGADLTRYLSIAVLFFVVVPIVVYVASWVPFFTRGQFHGLADLWQYQVQAYRYHATLTATHPYGSPWFSWPFLYRPVAYYYEYRGLGIDAWSGQNLVAGMVNLGNPIIWWAAIPAVVSLPYFVLRQRSLAAAVILVGFVTQFLPWARITRVIFLYHMFGGLTFMVLALAFVLARMAAAGELRLSVGSLTFGISGRGVLIAYLVVAAGFFLYFYPVWTGLPISEGSYLSGFPRGKMWFPSWI